MDSFTLCTRRSRAISVRVFSVLTRRERAFSLIELMVVTAIFVILSAVVLASNSRFGGRIILQNLAHDIGLSVRESQIYGIAVRRFDPSSGSGTFDYGYGIHFALGTSYELFADADGNGKWDPGETVKTTSLAGGYALTQICAPAATCDVSRVDILFKRPEPDACIGANGASSMSGGLCVSGITRTIITVSSPRGDSANILIDSSGQISIQ
jgi:prepilin-type N-terminal cleavage/methylation domain-containing protein